MLNVEFDEATANFLSSKLSVVLIFVCNFNKLQHSAKPSSKEKNDALCRVLGVPTVHCSSGFSNGLPCDLDDSHEIQLFHVGFQCGWSLTVVWVLDSFRAV